MRISDWSSDVCSSDLTRTGREKIADFAAAVAKMAPRVGMREKGAGFIMRIAAGEPLDQRPKRPNIDGALAPLGKIGARVGEGEGGREIETDQHILARGCNALQPGEYFGARPDMAGPDERGRRRAACDRERDAPLALGIGRAACRDRVGPDV